MTAPLITLTTDFGEGSPYVAQMKGVLFGMVPDARVVDVTHSIPPQGVMQAAFVLRDIRESFPSNTVHIVVVDPGVGTERKIVAARIESHWFVAPDNGVLSIVATFHQPSVLIAVDNPNFWRPAVSATFHGRDIMSPVGAHLSLGVDPRELGSATSRLTDLDVPIPRMSQQGIAGEIVMVDSFGNAVSNIPASALAVGPAADSIQISCRNRTIAGIGRTYGEKPAGAEVALIGSNGHLEIAVVNGSAATKLGIGVGDAIKVTWSQPLDASP